MLEKSTHLFYTTKGWNCDSDGIFTDASLYEDLRDYCQTYLSLNRRRLSSYFPKSGKLFLDCASGPIQYPEYLDYSLSYSIRYCIDLSDDALTIAKSRSPHHIETICGDLLTLDLHDLSFDTILSIHTIYHINRSNQFKAIDKLISALTPRGVCLIVYSNPNCIIEAIKKFIKFFRSQRSSPEFTFERLSIREIRCRYPHAELIPYRFFSGEDMRRIFPNSYLSKLILSLLALIEPHIPLFFVQYYIIKISYA